MRLLKATVTNPTFSRLYPLVTWIDATVLCARHHRSSKTGLATLRKSKSYGGAQALAAIKAAAPDARIEHERARLLARREPLGVGGAYDQDWTVSSATAISKSPRQAGLLRALAKSFAAEQVLELGTNVGISAAYLATAGARHIVTLEASPTRLDLARQLHHTLDLGGIEYVEGFFKDTLTAVLNKMPFVDFAFIDGHHEYQPTMDYFAEILPHAKPGAVIFFDDIRFSSGMWRAWSEASANSAFGLVLDFWTMGACIVKHDGEARLEVPPISCY